MPCGAVTIPGRHFDGTTVLLPFSSAIVLVPKTAAAFPSLIKHRHLTAQFGDGGVIAPDRHRGWQHHVLGDHSKELAVQRQMDDPIVRAVDRNDPHRVKSRVESQLVQSIKIIGLLLASERRDVFAFLVEPVNVIT